MSDDGLNPAELLQWDEALSYRAMDCGPGWWPTIRRLHEQLRAIDPDYRVVQVKQKFGGLRFYLAPQWGPSLGEKLLDAIREAEIECSKLCEECGKPGKLLTKGWWRVACEDHQE